MIREVDDIVEARQQGRALAQRYGFSASRATLVATAISELARNILLYAKQGELTLTSAVADGETGITIKTVDQGPGIANVQQALMSGYSSSGGMGLGLPGVQQIVDEFSIESQLGEGTTVICTMWP